MRILMAADFYPPFLGGMERQAQVLARELVARGHDVTIVSPWHPGLPAEEDDRGVHVRRIKGIATAVPWFFTVPGRRYHPPFPDPAVVWHLRRLIRTGRPDIVHARGWIAYSCVVALWGSKTPLLVSAHDYGYNCAVRSLMRHGRICDGPALGKCLACAGRSLGVPKGVAAALAVFFGRRMLRRRMAALHSVSRFVEQFSQRYLLDGRSRGSAPPSVLIPDIGSPTRLDTPDAADQAGEIRAQLPEQPFILFVGVLTRAKGLEPLLAAYEQLPHRPPLVLIGTVWPDTPSTVPAGVTLLRNVPNAAVLYAWKRCLFGVVPSLWAEPLPNVVLEAMMCGKAVVASRVGGIADLVVHEETGILVPPGDVAALTQAIQRLVEDGRLRQRLGQAGQARAQLYTAAAIVPRFEALYRQLARGLTMPRSAPLAATSLKEEQRS